MESHLPAAAQLAGAGVRIRIPVSLNPDPRLTPGLLRNNTTLCRLLKCHRPRRAGSLLPAEQLGSAPPALGRLAPPPGCPGAQPPRRGSTLSSVSGADPEETILNAFKVFDPEGKGVLKAD